MTEPTTAAGRALLSGGMRVFTSREVAEDWIVRIEAEARAAALDEALNAITSIPGVVGHAQCYDGVKLLAAIDALREKEE